MRRASEASRQMTQESYQQSPQELAAIKRERARTLELQNQVHTATAQEWMRSKGVQGRPGTAEWREGRRALLEELGVARFVPNWNHRHVDVETGECLEAA